MPVYYPGVKKYEMPYCLSIAILKLKDFIFDHQNLKKEHKFDVENVTLFLDDKYIVCYEMLASLKMFDI